MALTHVIFWVGQITFLWNELQLTTQKWVPPLLRQTWKSVIDDGARRQSISTRMSQCHPFPRLHNYDDEHNTRIVVRHNREKCIKICETSFAEFLKVLFYWGFLHYWIGQSPVWRIGSWLNKWDRHERNVKPLRCILLYEFLPHLCQGT